MGIIKDFVKSLCMSIKEDFVKSLCAFLIVECNINYELLQYVGIKCFASHIF